VARALACSIGISRCPVGKTCSRLGKQLILLIADSEPRPQEAIFLKVRATNITGVPIANMHVPIDSL
jgi:hypothetical protein